MQSTLEIVKLVVTKYFCCGVNASSVYFWNCAKLLEKAREMTTSRHDADVSVYGEGRIYPQRRYTYIYLYGYISIYTCVGVYALGKPCTSLPL